MHVVWRFQKTPVVGLHLHMVAIKELNDYREPLLADPRVHEGASATREPPRRLDTSVQDPISEGGSSKSCPRTAGRRSHREGQAWMVPAHTHWIDEYLAPQGPRPSRYLGMCAGGCTGDTLPGWQRAPRVRWTRYAPSCGTTSRFC